MNKVLVTKDTKVITTMTAPDFADAKEFAEWIIGWTDGTPKLVDGQIVPQPGPFKGHSLRLLRADESASPGDSDINGVITKAPPVPLSALEQDALNARIELRGLRIRDLTAAQQRRLLAIVCQAVGIDIQP